MKFKLFSFFRPATPLEIATRELVDAQVALLAAQTGHEWAAASVAYNQARIKRLSKTVSDCAREKKNELRP